MASHSTEQDAICVLSDHKASKYVVNEYILPITLEGEETALEPGLENENTNKQHRLTELPLANPSLHLPLILVLAGSAFLNTLVIQAIVPLMPTMAHDLKTAPGRQQWMEGAYYLSFGCALLLCGRIGDIYGRRIVFLCGSAWMAAATISAPFARNEISFDVLRGMQGLGAAANVPTAIGILGSTFAPGKQKNYAFTIYSCAGSLGSMLGYLSGGFLGQLLGWKWVFWILAIIACAVTVLGYVIIPTHSTQTSTASRGNSKDIDWLGGALCTISLLLLTVALTEGNVIGWSTVWIQLSIIVAMLLLGVFVFWEYWLEHRLHGTPLVRNSVWCNARFSAAQVIMSTTMASYYNYSIFLTYFYQEYLGLSLVQTAVRFIPQGVCGLVGNFIAAIALSRVRGNFILIASTILVSIASLLFAVPIPTHTTYWAYGFIAMCFCTLGVETLYPTIILFTVQAFPQEDQSLAGGLTISVLQIGRTIHLAIATAIQTEVMKKRQGRPSQDVAPGDPSLLQGLRAAHWFDFALAAAALAVVICFFRGKERVGRIAK